MRCRDGQQRAYIDRLVRQTFRACCVPNDRAEISSMSDTISTGNDPPSIPLLLVFCCIAYDSLRPEGYDRKANKNFLDVVYEDQFLHGLVNLHLLLFHYYLYLLHSAFHVKGCQIDSTGSHGYFSCNCLGSTLHASARERGELIVLIRRSGIDFASSIADDA